MDWSIRILLDRLSNSLFLINKTKFYFGCTRLFLVTKRFSHFVGLAKSDIDNQLARYQVRPESIDLCLAAIHEFVAYVRANESGTLRYEVWQERDDPTRFVHIFVFRDAEADRIHSESAAVKKFSSILYPECLAPVEFIDYQHVVSNI